MSLDIFLNRSLRCFILYQNREKSTKAAARLQDNREKLLKEHGYSEAEINSPAVIVIFCFPILSPWAYTRVGLYITARLY